MDRPASEVRAAPACRICLRPLNGQVVFDPFPPDGVIQPLLHKQCLAEAHRREQAEADRFIGAAVALLAAAKYTLDVLNQVHPTEGTVAQRLAGIGGLRAQRMLREAIARAEDASA